MLLTDKAAKLDLRDAITALDACGTRNRVDASIGHLIEAALTSLADAPLAEDAKQLLAGLALLLSGREK